MAVETVRIRNGALELIDQRKLPSREIWVKCNSAETVARAIETMVVRGAPAIGVAAAYGVALGTVSIRSGSMEDVLAQVEKHIGRLAKTRPTAVNLFWALERMRSRAFEAVELDSDLAELKRVLFAEAIKIHAEDLAANRAMADHGARLVPRGARVLTHCNAGALATSGNYGTALGVIKRAHEQGKKISVWVDETRPFLQGARLTAWECIKEGIPATLITDNMAGHFIQQGDVDCIVVGADRIAANGDTANKIGTYTLSVLAKAHGVPFYVAAPLSTVDLETPSGKQIPIEERDPGEVCTIRDVQLAPAGIHARHPAFDVTPSANITAIITEAGIARAPFASALKKLKKPAHRIKQRRNSK